MGHFLSNKYDVCTFFFVLIIKIFHYPDHLKCRIFRIIKIPLFASFYLTRNNRLLITKNRSSVWYQYRININSIRSLYHFIIPKNLQTTQLRNQTTTEHFPHQTMDPNNHRTAKFFENTFAHYIWPSAPRRYWLLAKRRVFPTNCTNTMRTCSAHCRFGFRFLALFELTPVLTIGYCVCVVVFLAFVRCVCRCFSRFSQKSVGFCCCFGEMWDFILVYCRNYMFV